MVGGVRGEGDDRESLNENIAKFLTTQLGGRFGAEVGGFDFGESKVKKGGVERGLTDHPKIAIGGEKRKEGFTNEIIKGRPSPNIWLMMNLFQLG